MATRAYTPISGTRTVSANGLKFALFEEGDGPLVILLHGFPDTAESWNTIRPAIARAGFRVAAPFLRGYAPTEVPTKDTTTETLAADVVAIADALGAETFRVVGHDWGAEAAYSAVGLAPKRVERLVTIGIPHRVAITFTPKIAWALRHFAMLNLPGAVARFARDDFATLEMLWRRWSPTWKFTEADLAPVKNAFSAPGSLNAAIGYYRAARLRAPAMMRAPIDVPTLCIAGADDAAVNLDVYHSAKHHFSGRYEVVAIPGGHFCHCESPQAFLDAAIPFLK